MSQICLPTRRDETSQRGCNKTTALGAYSSASDKETFGFVMHYRRWVCVWQPVWMPGSNRKTNGSKCYCWWLKSCTTWDVWNTINSGINYQPQLVSRISAINSMIEMESTGNGGKWVQAMYELALQDGRTSLLYSTLQGGRRCLKVSGWEVTWEVGLKVARVN